MKKFSIYLVAMLLSAVNVVYGQTETDTDTTTVTNTITAEDLDTTNCTVQLGVWGDCFSGYQLATETLSGNTEFAKLFHVDKYGHKVRQIIVLKEKWENTPDDLLEGDGGYRIAAVTPREYAILALADTIWGEYWAMCYPPGINNYNKDTVPNTPCYEICCYKSGYEGKATYGPTARENSRELMHFNDTINGVVYTYAAMAENKTSHEADYTPGKTNGKYNTRWMCCDPQETEQLRKKRNEYINSLLKEI